MKNAILAHLSAEYPWCDRFLYVSTTGSTNDQLKQLARQGAPHGTVLIADHQSNGHGRLGRSFQSAAGVGIYLSILLRPKCTAADLMHLTCAAAVAMCEAIEASVGIHPGIKWTNDLVFEKKKLGGILTELGFGKSGTVDYAIIGIGINCCQTRDDFAPEIRDIATSLSMVTEREVHRSKVAAAMMEALYQMDKKLLSEKEELIRQYRRNCITIGQEISLVRGEEVQHGTAVCVDDDGALVVRFSDGAIRSVNSGEVSVRGMYGYV